MAKKKQHIDEFFKEKLNGQELPLDGSEWSRLSAELQPKNKRKAFLWWLLLIPAISLGVLLFTYSGDDNQTTTEISGENQKVQRESIDNTNSTSDNTSSTSLEDIEESTSDNSRNATSENSTEINADAITNSDLADRSESNTDESINTGNSTQNELADGGNNANRTTSVGPITHEVPINTDNYAERSINLASIGLNGFEYQIIKPEFEALSTEKVKVNKQAPPVFGPVYLSFTASGNVNQQNISSDTAIQYTQYRNANENLSLTPQLSLAVHTEFKKFMLGAGISYVKKQQVLGSNFNSSPELRILLYDSVAFVDINLDTTWLPFNYRDSIIRTSNASYSLTAPTYHYVGIPLYLSKRLTLNNTFSLDLGLQLQSQFAVANSGTINSFKLKAKELGMDDINRFNLNAGIQIGLNYEFNPGFIIQLNTGIQQDLLDMSAAEGMAQRFSLYNTGIRFYYRIN